MLGSFQHRSIVRTGLVRACSHLDTLRSDRGASGAKVDPHLTSPHLTSPHLTSPHLTSPRPTKPVRNDTRDPTWVGVPNPGLGRNQLESGAHPDQVWGQVPDPVPGPGCQDRVRIGSWDGYPEPGFRVPIPEPGPDRSGMGTWDQVPEPGSGNPSRNPVPTGDRKSTRLNSSHVSESRMPSSA